MYVGLERPTDPPATLFGLAMVFLIGWINGDVGKLDSAQQRFSPSIYFVALLRHIPQIDLAIHDQHIRDQHARGRSDDDRFQRASSPGSVIRDVSGSIGALRHPSPCFRSIDRKRQSGSIMMIGTEH